LKKEIKEDKKYLPEYRIISPGFLSPIVLSVPPFGFAPSAMTTIEEK